MKPVIRHAIAMFLHLVATFISVGNLFWILYVHRASLLLGRGLGSFVVPWFVIYFFVSLVIWFAAHSIEKNKNFSKIYWIGIMLALLLMILAPINFA